MIHLINEDLEAKQIMFHNYKIKKSRWIGHKVILNDKLVNNWEDKNIYWIR